MVSSDDSPIFNLITEAIEKKGYFISNSALPSSTSNTLLAHFQSLRQTEFKQAAIGRKQQQVINPTIRSDAIYWLEPQESAIQDYWDWIEQLRLSLNQDFFLGLFDYECHYAYYDKGAFYQKHIDAFKGSSNRVITVIHYLTPHWQTEQGGELLLYAQDGQTVLEKVSPEYGKTVIFLSTQFPHQVLPSYAPRYSLTGWFRIKAI